MTHATITVTAGECRVIVDRLLQDGETMVFQATVNPGYATAFQVAPGEGLVVREDTRPTKER